MYLPPKNTKHDLIVVARVNKLTLQQRVGVVLIFDEEMEKFRLDNSVRRTQNLVHRAS